MLPPLFLRGVPPRAPRLKAPSTRTRAKSCAIIAALGEICGLARNCRGCIRNPLFCSTGTPTHPPTQFQARDNSIGQKPASQHATFRLSSAHHRRTTGRCPISGSSLPVSRACTRSRALNAHAPTLVTTAPEIPAGFQQRRRTSGPGRAPQPSRVAGAWRLRGAAAAGVMRAARTNRPASRRRAVRLARGRHTQRSDHGLRGASVQRRPGWTLPKAHAGNHNRQARARGQNPARSSRPLMRYAG